VQSNILHRYVPAHFRHPWRLATRLLQTRDSAALYAMYLAAAGVAAAPLDLLLSSVERRREGRVGAGTTGPLVFICGAPRTGTTLVHQTLVRHLPVSHFNNLTALFPASPLTATRLFARFLGEPVVDYTNFYGRTTRLSGVNDALHLWDRWVGSDRINPQPCLSPAAADKMLRFFVAWREVVGQPLVAKCNHLNAAAHLIANVLPEATFICVERDPLWHAQSLYQARKLIHDDHRLPYGLTDSSNSTNEDPIDSVVRQVRFHADLAETQQRRIGVDRFWRVRYEEFCSDPGRLVQRVARTINDRDENGRLTAGIPPHRCANVRTMDLQTFQQLEAALELPAKGEKQT
jgi:hypothetical protein